MYLYSGKCGAYKYSRIEAAFGRPSGSGQPLVKDLVQELEHFRARCDRFLVASPGVNFFFFLTRDQPEARNPSPRSFAKGKVRPSLRSLTGRGHKPWGKRTVVVLALLTHDASLSLTGCQAVLKHAIYPTQTDD